VLLELREMYGRRPSMRQRVHLQAERWRIRRALGEADLLMVAFAKQRELYKETRAQIIEVPFGADDGQRPTTNGQRDDWVVWGGGGRGGGWPPAPLSTPSSPSTTPVSAASCSSSGARGRTAI